jgi:hypothetical protein
VRSRGPRFLTEYCHWITSCYMMGACGDGLSSLSETGEKPEPEPVRDDLDALKAAKLAADLKFVEEKKLQTIARRRETEIRNAQRKRELISRSHVLKQAAFLVLALRARLLAIPAQHAASCWT